MTIDYTLSMPVPHSHLFEVEVRVPSTESVVEVTMPVWTPGSYLVREFARNVQDLAAHDVSGLPLSCRKISKHSWRIEGGSPGPLTIRYRVHANELTVRTSHLDASHGYVNGASVFVFVRGMENDPVRVRILAPEGWRVATSLHESEDGTFRAADYDELVDSPIEIGTHRTIAWTQEGLPHRFAVWGPGEIDEARLEADTRRIIDVCSRMFGGLPYEGYLFILHLVPDGRGGLEHRASSTLQCSPASLASDYESLVALVAHEFFHVWLAKRIRPAVLGPFDYTAENYTRLLWVVEGVTTYYTDLILVRSGVITPDRYLERQADSIARFRSTPGRHHQTLEDSSFDTWIKFYRPDAHTPNSQVSYYHKGSLVALAIDMEIRRASEGARSLDDVMQLLWTRHGLPDVGIPEDEPGGIRDVVREVWCGGRAGSDDETGASDEYPPDSGAECDRLFAAYVSGLDEIDFDRHLEVVGLRAMWATDVTDRNATAWRSPILPGRDVWPGVRLREDGGRIRVTNVLEGTPAADAGVNSGDEILAVNGLRARRTSDGSLAGVARGAETELTLLRRETLLTIRVAGGDAVEVMWGAPVAIVENQEVGSRAAGHRDRWLGRTGAEAGRIGSSAAPDEDS